jgi:glycosyltransferase involved in cell wall biosynthesis
MRLQTPFHRLAFPLTRFIYHHSDAIVVYGEHVKRYLVSEGVPAERIFVAAHAVDNDAHAIKVREDEVAALRQKHKIGPRQKVVLYLGRLEEVKGLSYLLNAFASLQRDEEVLVLAGTGSERPFLERSAEDLGIADRVRFTGYISPENAVPYYALAYVFVLPSITLPAGKELWGLVINEAFNQGVPVIATDAVGAAAGGLVQDGVNGFVVAERNVEPLRQALQLILEDTELRERLSTNAKQTISKWDNENMVLGFRQAIAYVLRGR